MTQVLLIFYEKFNSLIVLYFEFHYDITQLVRIFVLKYDNAAQLSHSLWTIGNHINIDKYNTWDKPRFFFMTNLADRFMLHVSLWHRLIRMFVFYHEHSAQ